MTPKHRSYARKNLLYHLALAHDIAQNLAEVTHCQAAFPEYYAIQHAISDASSLTRTADTKESPDNGPK